MNFNSMINKDGTKKFAYIMLLMLTDEYVPPSIVLAESLKKIGCLADLVILIDEKIITDEITELLKIFYDKERHVDTMDTSTTSKLYEYNNPLSLLNY